MGANENKRVVPEKAFFSKRTPFGFHTGMIVYIEPSWNGIMNNYLCNNYENIEKNSNYHNSFVYFPNIIKQMEKIVHYSIPNYKEKINENIYNLQAEIHDMYKELFACRIDKQNWAPTTPMLLSYEYEEDDYEVVLLWPLHYENKHQFEQLLNRIVSRDPFEGVRCSSIDEYYPPDDPRDYADRESVYKIAREVKTRIEKLKLMGVSEYVIRHLVSLPEAKLSRLRITNDYRIILIDYNNMEIPMPTLSKVVFFFFLRHPEGMRFKDMQDYKNELLQIYCRLSNRENIDRMEQSIEELVDTTRNSINEKCSRIRTAFVSRFSEELANNYCITGYLGREKRITLDRSLVIDEVGLFF